VKDCSKLSGEDEAENGKPYSPRQGPFDFAQGKPGGSAGEGQYGVRTARRAWLEKADVLNTLPVDKLLKALRHSA